MAVAWPGGVPYCFDGWSETEADTVIRTETEAGPMKMRRRYTGVVSQIQASCVLTLAQYRAFRTWLRTDVQQGSLPFILPDPTDNNTPREFRFLEPPRVSSAGPVAVSISVSMERRGA